MSQIARTLLAFLRRDLRTMGSYRFALLLQLFAIANGLWIYFFLGRTVGAAATPVLAGYGADFFAFILVGIAFWGLLTAALMGTRNAVQAEQRSGTLEALLVTPIPSWLAVVAGSGQSLLLGAFEVLAYLGGGALFFHLDYSRANWVTLAVVLVLAVVHSGAIGLMIAALVIVVKRGEQAVAVVAGALTLLTGIFYPVEVLPEPLRLLAGWLPLTRALSDMRLALFRGAALADLAADLAILVVSTVLLAGVGTWVLNRALDRARMDGSLTQF